MPGHHIQRASGGTSSHTAETFIPASHDAAAEAQSLEVARVALQRLSRNGSSDAATNVSVLARRTIDAWVKLEQSIDLVEQGHSTLAARNVSRVRVDLFPVTLGDPYGNTPSERSMLAPLIVVAGRFIDAAATIQNPVEARRLINQAVGTLLILDRLVAQHLPTPTLRTSQ